jgi:hypothetical protein
MLRAALKALRKQRYACARAERIRARRAAEKKVGRGYDWVRHRVRVALCEELLAHGPREIFAFSVVGHAAKWGCAPRTVRAELACLEAAGVVERTNKTGGRGRPLELRILRPEVLRQRTRESRILSPQTPHTQIQNASSGPSAEAEPSAFNQKLAPESSPAPSMAAVIADQRRLHQIRDVEAQRRARLRNIRQACWQKGLPLNVSLLITAAAGALAATVGKAGKRMAVLEDCWGRVRTAPAAELLELAGSWPRMKAWVAGPAVTVSRLEVAGENTTTPASSPALAPDPQLPLWASSWLDRMVKRARAA